MQRLLYRSISFWTRIFTQHQGELTAIHIGRNLFQVAVALHKLLPGGAVADHDHHDQEVTVVLCGRFSDEDGVYKEGDFLVRQPGQIHRPTVTNNEECICLSVTDAPVKFTGMFTRLLNPIVAYQHKH